MNDMYSMMSNEAKDRLDKLVSNYNMNKQIYKDYIESGELYYTDFNGIVRKLSNSLYEKVVKSICESHEMVPYYVIMTRTSFGDLINILFVSKYEEDWRIERESGGIVHCWVENLSEPMFSEYGSIAIKSIGGTLIRVE